MRGQERSGLSPDNAARQLLMRITGGNVRATAIYSRVSTDHQTTENQERELRGIADRMGWTVVNVYRDQGVSGAK